jgi:hypothetical protein
LLSGDYWQRYVMALYGDLTNFFVAPPHEQHAPA